MAQTDVQRTENLAILFQEVLTAIERLRANTQSVTDAKAFRHHNREALRVAAQQALAAGYAADMVKYTTFVCVAFLDESVLKSQKPIFGDWLREPLQHELFGTATAGEGVFQNLDHLLAQNDAPDLADVLEVHYLCLVLGFWGRYSAANRGELAQKMSLTADKIRRIRGRVGPLAPGWALPSEKVPTLQDPWVKRLGILAVVTLVLAIGMFVLYKVSLGSAVSGVQAAAGAARSQP